MALMMLLSELLYSTTQVRTCFEAYNLFCWDADFFTSLWVAAFTCAALAY